MVSPSQRWLCGINFFFTVDSQFFEVFWFVRVFSGQARFAGSLQLWRPLWVFTSGFTLAFFKGLCVFLLLVLSGVTVCTFWAVSALRTWCAADLWLFWVFHRGFVGAFPCRGLFVAVFVVCFQ